MQSETVKIHRSVLETVIKELKLIAAQEKANDSYAYALGMCNGRAKTALIELEVAMGSKQ